MLSTVKLVADPYPPYQFEKDGVRKAEKGRGGEADNTMTINVIRIVLLFSYY